jgi:hypothetical protein
MKLALRLTSTPVWGAAPADRRHSDPHRSAAGGDHLDRPRARRGIGCRASARRRLEAAGYVEIEKTFKGKVPLTLVSLTTTGSRAFANYRRQMASLLADAK